MRKGNYKNTTSGARKILKAIGPAAGLSLVALLTACGGGGGSGGGEQGSALVAEQQASGTIREDQWHYYYYDLPTGHDAARITLSASSGDVEMLLSAERYPDWSMYNNDQEDCYDWAEPGLDGVCEGEDLDPGRYYIGLVGWDPVSQYSLTAESWASTAARSFSATPLSTEAMSSEEALDQDQLRIRIASLYLKSRRDSDIPRREWLPEDMPEAGMVMDARGGEKYRFYFGADAVTPAVLSVDMNGHWQHFDSMAHFRDALDVGR